MRFPFRVAGPLLVALLVGLAASLVWRASQPGPPRPDSPLPSTDEVAADLFPSGYRHADAVSVLPALGGWRAGWNQPVYIQDNLWTAADGQYAVWVDADGNPRAGRRVRGGGWEQSDLSEVRGNPLAAPTEPDPHHVYAIAVDARGYVHVAGNMHADELRYVRSTRPHAIENWTAATMIGEDESAVTYPSFVGLPDGTLLFAYRDGGSGSGDVILNALGPESRSWQRLGTVLDGRASGQSPYVQRLAVDADRGVLHTMHTWRKTGSPDTNRDITYARSRDGGRSWVDSAERELPSPITRETVEVVARGPTEGHVLINQGGLAIDTAGRPHGAFRLRDRRGDSHVRHVWHDGERWRGGRVDGVDRPDSRPTVATTSSGGVHLLWTRRAPGGGATLFVTDITPDRCQRATQPLLVAGKSGYEPSVDSQALRDHDRLHLLVPAGVADGPVPAVVVSYDLVALDDELHARSSRCPPTAAGNSVVPAGVTRTGSRRPARRGRAASLPAPTRSRARPRPSWRRPPPRKPLSPRRSTRPTAHGRGPRASRP